MKIDDKMYDEIFREEEDTVQEINLNKSGAVAAVFDWSRSLLLTLVAVLVVMTFLFRIVKVDGVSMESTLIDTDKVVVTDLFYTPSDGDVVVISHGESYDAPLIKRVIATAGQTLKIDFEKNEVYVDGVLLKEDYIQGKTVMGDLSESEIPSVIPEGKVFVMGDNRSVSKDSRYREVGLIDQNDIIGKAQFVLIPHTYRDESGRPGIDLTKIRYLY